MEHSEISSYLNLKNKEHVMKTDHAILPEDNVYLYDNERVRRIPFLVKMPYQSEEVVYNKTFSPMLVTKDLLLELLSGTIRDPQAAVKFLDTHSATGFLKTDPLK